MSCQISSDRSYITTMREIVSTTESERRSGPLARAAAEVIAEGEDESRFERIRQLTHDNAPCYTYQTFEGEASFEWPEVHQAAGGGSE